jgi:hypothetical protein
LGGPRASVGTVDRHSHGDLGFKDCGPLGRYLGFVTLLLAQGLGLSDRLLQRCNKDFQVLNSTTFVRDDLLRIGTDAGLG